MRLEFQILLAFALDLAVGDPPWLPHPVRGIALFARMMERVTRRVFRSERLAGIITALAVYSACGFAAFGLLRFAGWFHPVAADIVSILLIYTTIAARDLAGHSMAVLRPLVHGDLPAARKKVAMIVGRDTDQLDAPGVVRAAVESVAESTVDGVTAPLLFAIVAGPIGAVVYRAINTLDSLFGYTSDRYQKFGWASARIDDLANWIPARLTGPLIGLAAALLAMRPLAALRIMVRDAGKHASPNSGWPEAAMAGAMGVQVGGQNFYGGQPLDKPTIGDPLTALTAKHIRQANALMFVTAALFLAAGLAARFAVMRFI